MYCKSNTGTLFSSTCS